MPRPFLPARLALPAAAALCLLLAGAGRAADRPAASLQIRFRLVESCQAHTGLVPASSAVPAPEIRCHHGSPRRVRILPADRVEPGFLGDPAQPRQQVDF